MLKIKKQYSHIIYSYTAKLVFSLQYYMTQSITTFQALQQNMEIDFYNKTLKFPKGCSVVLLLVCVIYKEVLLGIISNAEENVKNNVITEFVSKGIQLIHSLLICDGYQDYINISKRYSQISDILFLILIKYFQHAFVLMLFLGLAYQLPNFQKDICESGQMVMYDVLFLPRVFNQRPLGNYLHHYYETLLISRIILIFIIALQREIQKLFNYKFNISAILLTIVIIVIIYNFIKLIQISFYGGKFFNFQHFQFNTFYNIHSYCIGCYIASKLYIFKYNEHELNQVLEIHPTQTVIGSYINRISTSKLLVDIYLLTISIFSTLLIYYKSYIVHDKLNFINRAFIFIISDCLYLVIVTIVQVFYNFGIVKYTTDFFDQHISSRQEWIIGSTVFTSILNKYIFNSIVFGPYNVIMVLIMIFGIGIEIYFFSCLFYIMFNQIYEKILSWIVSSGDNTAIFIIKLVTGKMTGS